LIWIAAYLFIGTVVGILAGMLGIGGGMTLVPVLSAMFSAQALAPEHSVHLALGTGMASVLFTASASVRAHHGVQAVDWRIVRSLAPAMALGTLASTAASGWFAQRALALSFACIAFVGSAQMLLGRAPASAQHRLPDTAGLWGCGLVIGGVCGLVSAGGAFLTVPFMLWCGVAMHTAIGTGAALGLPVALVGSVGYVISGWHVQGLPHASLGFVYLPALIAVVSASMLSAPLGARLAHRLPVQTLRRVFALLLFALASKMVFSYW
jgi:uncharacterized membrane protein YfcA